MDTVATTQVLRDNLNNLGVFAATVNGNINKINGEFNKNYTQLLARGASIDIQSLSCRPLLQLHDDYLNSKLINLTHEHDWLRQKGL